MKISISTEFSLLFILAKTEQTVKCKHLLLYYLYAASYFYIVIFYLLMYCMIISS